MPAFYELEENARVALTAQAIKERRTLFERWSNLREPEAGGWNPRAAVAAEFLTDRRSVADLGCGLMGLERMLAPGTVYIPVDVVRRDHRTYVVDFNSESVCSLPAAAAAAALGLLPYLFDVPLFMRSLARAYPLAVVSYNPIGLAESDLTQRRAHAWVNDYSRSEMETIFYGAGWSIERSDSSIGGGQILWQLTAERG